MVLITNSFGVPVDAKKVDKVNALNLFGRCVGYHVFIFLLSLLQ